MAYSLAEGSLLQCWVVTLRLVHRHKELSLAMKYFYRSNLMSNLFILFIFVLYSILNLSRCLDSRSPFRFNEYVGLFTFHIPMKQMYTYLNYIFCKKM